MAFNLSGVDPDLYFDVNLAINLSLFGFLVFPPLLLCLLSVLGLILTKAISKKIRVLLINIFAAEICNWISYSAFYLGFPIRLAFSNDYSCQFFISSTSVSATQKYMAAALYAIYIHIFIKRGEKVLKWKVIIPYIAITWTISILFGALPYTRQLGVININGFCTADIHSPAYTIATIPFVVLAVASLIIQLVWSILTVVYVKKNTLTGNKRVKKAAAKILIYLAVTSILSFLYGVVQSANPAIRNALPENNIVGIVAVNYILRIAYNIPPYATSIVAIALLKPVRVALLRVCCPHRYKKSEEPENPPDTPSHKSPPESPCQKNLPDTPC